MSAGIRTILMSWVVGLIVLAFIMLGAILTAPDDQDVPVPEQARRARMALALRRSTSGGAR